MASHLDQHSILHGLDTKDFDAARRIMTGIALCLQGTTIEAAAAMAELKDDEHNHMARICNLAQNNPDLSSMVLAFAHARYAYDADVARAIRDLDTFATHAVLYPTAANARDKKLVMELRSRQASAGAFVYIRGDVGDNNGGIVPETGAVAAIRGKHSELHDPFPEGIASEKGVLPEGYEKPLIVETRSRNKSKHCPQRRRGDTFLKEDNINMDKAAVGRAQPEKLKLTFKICRKNPEHPNQIMVPHPIVTFEYNGEVDWMNKDSVDRLNAWANQIRVRGGLVTPRKARLQWLAIEKDWLIDHLSMVLDAPATGGRWTSIDWKSVEQAFNGHFAGMIFSIDAVTAETSYKARRPGDAAAKEITAKERKLRCERKFVPREASGIRHAFENFACPRAKELMEKAKAGSKSSASSEKSTPANGGKRSHTKVGNDDDDLPLSKRSRNMDEEDAYTSSSSLSVLSDADFESMAMSDLDELKRGGTEASRVDETSAYDASIDE